MPEHIIPPRVIVDARNKCYCLLQEYTPMRNLTEEDFADPVLRAEIEEELLPANARIEKEFGESFDFMGWKFPQALMGPYLANIGIREQPAKRRLGIVDVALLKLQKPYHRFLQWVQRLNLIRLGLKTRKT